jgi:hypothetical protein
MNLVVSAAYGEIGKKVKNFLLDSKILYDILFI